jgi:uncharacterized protein YjbI with pentapeptide repeats
VEFHHEAVFFVTAAVADFSSAKFLAEADFMFSKFEAQFSEAEFSKKVEFGLARFSGDSNLSAEFYGEADFISAEFSKNAYFRKAKFSKMANFQSAEFHQEAHFSSAEFSGEADFSAAKFYGEADFSAAKFSKMANFHSAGFSAEAKFGGLMEDQAFFNEVLFEDGRKIQFKIEDLSKISFINTDITRVRFNDRARWGKDNRFKVIEEELLEKNPEKFSLGSVMAVYRNLRENYEFRLRYDEAGEFFKREMELKRRYREIISQNGSNTQIKLNGLMRRNFSLTGLYYHFSDYGESILKPTIIGIVIVGLSTLFWLIQNNPISEPSLSFIANTEHNFINVTQIMNNTHSLKAFERSLGDFLPLLSLGNIKVGIIDYVIKIVGGALTFVLLAVALRRKFERKYTR